MTQIDGGSSKNGSLENSESKTGLIGYSGFVGGQLARQHQFTHCYNSKNFQEMRNNTYSELVCAGISAVKWLANKEPEKDIQKIQELQNVLTAVQAERFILISTIDVYPKIENLDESFDCRSMENNAYGTHRLQFEEFCQQHFQDCTIVRLPGLFGRGLKKNVIYDLLNDNCLEMINRRSSFQYYNLDNLWSDIQKTLAANIKLINFFTEPVTTAEIIDNYFPDKSLGQNAMPEVHYDLRTIHANLWGKQGHYAYTKDDVLRQMSEFIQHYNTETTA